MRVLIFSYWGYEDLGYNNFFTNIVPIKSWTTIVNLWGLFCGLRCLNKKVLSPYDLITSELIITIIIVYLESFIHDLRFQFTNTLEQLTHQLLLPRQFTYILIHMNALIDLNVAPLAHQDVPLQEAGVLR